MKNLKRCHQRGNEKISWLMDEREENKTIKTERSSIKRTHIVTFFMGQVLRN